MQRKKDFPIVRHDDPAIFCRRQQAYRLAGVPHVQIARRD